MTAHLLMRHGEASLALPVGVVHGIAPAATAVPLPRSAPWVEGVAAYGRHIVAQIALGELVGGPVGGAVAVVAESAVGKVALRVDAVDRVVDLDTPAAPPPGEAGLVCGLVRRDRHEIRLLDPGRLALPPPGAPDPRASHPSPVDTDANGWRTTGPGRPPAALLACAIGSRRVLLPLDRVVAIERAAPHRPADDAVGPGLVVTLRLDGGEGVLGIDRVIGLRGADALADAELFDLATLERVGAPALGQRALPVTERRSALLLIAAGARHVLVPFGKVARIAWSEHWRPVPGGIVPGVAAVSGEILPVIDLGRLFGDASAPRPIMVALEVRGSRWAVACDHVSERHAPMEGRPLTIGGLPTLATAQVAEGSLPVLDVDRLPLPVLRP